MVSTKLSDFAKGTPMAAKRSDIAKSTPGIGMGKKFAIATAQTKKVFKKKTIKKGY